MIQGSWPLGVILFYLGCCLSGVGFSGVPGVLG